MAFEWLKKIGRQPDSITPKGSQQHRERVIDLAGKAMGRDLTAESDAAKLGSGDTQDRYPKGKRVSFEKAAKTQRDQQNAVANARDAENQYHDVPALKGRAPCQVQKDEARGQKQQNPPTETQPKKKRGLFS